ncbi:hypothetical protein BX616_008652 [Lobosporangium transversale]|uniref:Concanavalin A-like lectin/glucanase domain-containing protein n=1 Tax=Lobosporangium transversale TaxID=64571 RepID=A0A1Y2FZH0_9FUNG|nr:concanavalin A-like lectin/glucanase domain-containing protein [Lobosporangium transversale]KAF9895872.1 hypothetical protein BX616_008652 [Lobosporangium transversale]ORY89576.1 concanavalin A-like lectin/glucanase domain-containing protein [Lobosporangium transversale]|eukprot:XP_021875065.1 concanavalin A-like lectin/glucanase domain-containing protein [Lobosporangium transversale]
MVMPTFFNKINTSFALPTAAKSSRAPFFEPLINKNISSDSTSSSNGLQNFIIPNNVGPSAWSCTYMRDSVSSPGPSETGTVISIKKGSPKKSFSCGELISRETQLDYGRYSVDMISTAVKGHVTALFLMSPGGTSEIDIELTGLDPNIVHLNVWLNGRQNPVRVPLGFDASKGWHNYAVEWRKDSITWFVDGKQVLKRTGPVIKTVPPKGTNYKLVLNAWTNNGNDNWAGKFVWPKGRNVKVQSHFKNLKYTP